MANSFLVVGGLVILIIETIFSYTRIFILFSFVKLVGAGRSTKHAPLTKSKGKKVTRGELNKRTESPGPLRPDWTAARLLGFDAARSEPQPLFGHSFGTRQSAGPNGRKTDSKTDRHDRQEHDRTVMIDQGSNCCLQPVHVPAVSNRAKPSDLCLAQQAAAVFGKISALCRRTELEHLTSQGVDLSSDLE
jgi:hypothetical protein